MYKTIIIKYEGKGQKIYYTDFVMACREIKFNDSFPEFPGEGKITLENKNFRLRLIKDSSSINYYTNDVEIIYSKEQAKKYLHTLKFNSKLNKLIGEEND